MSDSSTSRFAALFESALLDYENQTGTSLAEHPLTQQLENCDSIESITTILHEKARAFGEFRGSDGRMMRSLKSTVSVLYTLSTSSTLGEAVGLPFPPAKAIFAGFAVLLAAVKDVSASYDALVDLLESIEHFLNRLNIYTNIPPTPAMAEIIVKIMVELLSTLALVTKQIRQRRPMKFVKKLLGENDVESVLQRLDRLTQDEARSTAAQTLEVVYSLVQNMRVVMDDGKASVDGVRGALEIIQQIASEKNKSKRDKMQQNIRNWLSPPDPWKNHNIARSSRHAGTAEWFVQGDMFSKWKSSQPGSHLWIHGKPGAGKTILCSTVIQDIDAMRKSGLASLAFFYCDFREDQKKDHRGLLSSVLVQLCHQSDSYCDVLSGFYLEHAKGSQYPSDDALIQCLKDILKLPGQAPVYLIVDALDECPNTSAMPSPREKVLMLVAELIESHIPNLRVCVTSRPETDIKAVLDDLTFHSFSLHNERGQMEDIDNYIKSVVYNDPKMRRWKAQDKQAVIDLLTKKADGMFRWVYCQVVYLRRCLPGRIQQALEELPKTLDETYERTLQDIDEANWESAYRLFQCVAVAARPLRVEEVTESLALDFNAGPIPRFLEGWRPEDPVDAALSTCSSLLAIVNAEDSPVIQFSHFSVKEFLTSPRLAESNDITCRRYHISMTPAHTLVAQACLGLLLYLDRNITNGDLQKFPLAEYAAQHWVSHTQFEDVSRNAEDGMKQLFDPDRPHLAVWVWVHDPDILSRRRTKRADRPLQPSGTPLHYAALCGFHRIVKYLLTERSVDVDSRGFNDKSTPLHRASSRGHVEVVRVLLGHGADATARAMDGSTPLHRASSEGHFQVARVLLEHGADVAARDKHGWAPLDEVSFGGHVELACILLEHGADMTAQAKDGSTPLHLASSEGHGEVARVLLERGADVTARTEHGSTPLHLASSEGHVHVARVLLEHGANVKVRDNLRSSTPLHRASSGGHMEVTRFLLEQGADATAEDKYGSTPVDRAKTEEHSCVLPILFEYMHVTEAQDFIRWNPLHGTSSGGHGEVAHDLPEQDADAVAQDEDGWTSLHRASFKGDVGLVHILLQRGADVTAQAMGGWTPLHLASQEGHVEVVRDLLEHGADVTAGDEDESTPLHRASESGHVELARILLEYGANPSALCEKGTTPLHRASEGGHVELARLLLDHAANPSAKNDNGTTPLHRASDNGHAEVAHLLIERGADPTAQNNKRKWTPLHRASSGGHVELTRVLLEHGADATTQTEDGLTALHLASIGSHAELGRLLLQHGADPTAQDQDKTTLFQAASFGGNLKMANVLLEYGADPTAKGDEDYTPLHNASSGGHVAFARFLLEHGADTAARDHQEWTPLHHASQGGHIETARLLLEYGADVAAQDEDGMTPIHLVSSRGCVDVMRLLLECGADATAQAQDGLTPLHVAAKGGRVEVARILLEHGADASAEGEDGSTPWSLASELGYTRVTRLLLQYGANTGTDSSTNTI